jgi:hypothetical protein
VNQPEEWDELETGESLDEFEQHLQLALRRFDAPEGFADRVMARATANARSRAKVIAMRPRVRAWMSGAIAAALLGGVFVTQQVRVRHQREEAQLAQQQFEAGMRITDQALEHAREQLAQAGVR